MGILQNYEYLIIVLAFWEVIWKGLALWNTAIKGRKMWFVVILVLNTVGILPIIYLLVDKYELIEKIKLALNEKPKKGSRKK